MRARQAGADTWAGVIVDPQSDAPPLCRLIAESWTEKPTAGQAVGLVLGQQSG